MANHYIPSSGDHLDPIGRGEQCKTCKACDGTGKIWEYNCGSCGERVEPLKDGVSRTETKILNGKEYKLQFAEYACNCGYQDVGLKDWLICHECNGKGYV